MGLITDIGEKSEILKEFIRYLKDNGIYSSYFNHLNSNRNEFCNFNLIYHHDKKYFFQKCPPHLWLTECFCWADQNEGHGFWEEFHNEWFSYKTTNKSYNVKFYGHEI